MGDAKLPDWVRDLLALFVARYPLPMCPGCPFAARESAVRAWLMMFIEQLAYSYPGEGWCAKRADPGRPVSCDTLARHTATGFMGWDLVVSAGAEDQALNPGAEALDLTGQTPVPVEPHNHLGEVAPVPNPDPLPNDPALNAVMNRLEGIEAQLVTIDQTLRDLARDSQARDGYMQSQLTGVTVALGQMSSAIAALQGLTFEGKARAWFGTLTFEIKPKATS